MLDTQTVAPLSLSSIQGLFYALPLLKNKIYLKQNNRTSVT